MVALGNWQIRQFPISTHHSQCPSQVECESLSRGGICLGGHLEYTLLMSTGSLVIHSHPNLTGTWAVFFLHCEPGSSLSFALSVSYSIENPLSSQPFQLSLGAWATKQLRGQPPCVSSVIETILNK